MQRMFEDELDRIEAEMQWAAPRDMPWLFRRIPLPVFGQLLLEIPTKYPRMQAFFPTMASDDAQDLWTGAHGEALLAQTVAFVTCMNAAYAAMGRKPIEDSRILDFGCGWGRVARLLYKLTAVDNIYAVDPWNESIALCKEHRLNCHLALSDWMPESLPFAVKFDLIFAMSVFTHLSEQTAQTALRTLRRHLDRNGLLVVTVRPREYWDVHDGGRLAAQMQKMHDEVGFAFSPHKLAPSEGGSTYGDASISLTYFEEQLPDWTLASIEYNPVDPHQIILFLKPRASRGPSTLQPSRMHSDYRSLVERFLPTGTGGRRLYTRLIEAARSWFHAPR